MGKYARGKHAVLIDDRSGWKIRYKDARTEWTGFRVYKGDWEPKQPQLDPEMYIEGGDPSVLYKPRPPQNTSSTIVQLGSLYGKWSGQCAANLGRVSATQPADAPSGFQMTGVLNATGIAIAIVLPVASPGVATSALGTVTIAAVEDAVGFEATAGLGTVVEKLIQPVTGFVGTTGLGTAIVDLVEDAAGFAGTTTLGSITVNVSETVSGVELGTLTASLGTSGLFVNGTEIPPGLAGTGGLGTLILNAVHPVTGLVGTSALGSAQAEIITAVPVAMSAMTAHLGTASITSPSWGTLTWGRDTWGE